MKKVKLGAKGLIYPMPAFLVGADVDGKPNFMVASWAGVACSDPPMVSVAIKPHRHTFKGIRQNKAFSVNIPPVSLMKQTDYCGMFSGAKEPDKTATAGFTVFYGETKGAPMIGECHVSLECTTVLTLELGSHNLIIGKVIEVHASERALGPDGTLDPALVDPLIFSVPDRNYRRMGEIVGKAFKVGAEQKGE